MKPIINSCGDVRMAGFSDHLYVVWGLAAAVLIGLALLVWLNLSRSRLAKSWRLQAQDSRHALDAREPETFPHMHVVDGVVITHSHIDGQHEHHHETITISIEHYAQLVRRGEQRQS